MQSSTKAIIVIIFIGIMLSLRLFAGTHQPRGKKAVVAEQSITLANGVMLKYAEHGYQRGAPVIFLHGYTDSWRSFEDVLSRFPKTVHVIAISQRGHGNSDKPDSYKLKEFAGDLAQFISYKRLGPCFIVGHSLGGLVAQQFAIDYPQLTKAIVIESSAPSFADNQGVPEFLAEVMTLSDPVDRKFAEAFQTSTVAKPLTPDVMNLYIDESGKLPARVWKGIASGILQVDYSGDLRTINAPALILWGTNDAFCSKADQDQFVSGLRSSKLITYEGLGHAIHWEDPSRFVKDVLKFIRSQAK